jgi:hypothetical protein
MKKMMRFIAIALLICFALGMSATAHYDGIRDQERHNVPKVNPDNPSINFDGTVDLEGEWAGALHYTLDITTLNEDLTIWDHGVWGGETIITHWDDVPEAQRLKWDYYMLWDDRGLYIAVVNENDTTYSGPLNVAALLEGTIDPDTVPDRHSFMISPTDEFDGMDSSPGNMYWWYFYPVTDQGEFWMEGQTTTWNSYANNPENLPVRIAGKRDAQPNAQGYYPYSMEIFIPWNGLKFDTEGKPGQWEFDAVEGWTFTMGTIAEDRTGDVTKQIRVTNAKGWLNYDFFTLAGPVDTVVGEVAPVEVVTNEAEATPAAPATPAPVAAPAPATNDMIIILLILTVAAAAVFVKVKAKNK